MDIFNRKKVKKLEEEIYSLNNEIEGYIKNERNWSKQIDNLEKISTKTMEENQKLIKWIETILDTVGVMEVREKRQIRIPVYIDKSIRAYDINYMGIFEKERITIPEITIVKNGIESRGRKMREIEFRGKNKLTGKWVYGNLLVKKTKRKTETLEEKLYDYKYSIQYLNKNGRYCTVEVIEDTIGQLIGIGEYGKIYEGMKLYDEYEEEDCIPEYDDEECCFRLVYTSNYAERIENLYGLIPIIEEGE